MGRRRLGAAMAIAMGAAACNGGGGGGGPITIDQLPAREAAVLCDYAARCGLDTTVQEGLLGSAGGDCTSSFTLYFANSVFAQYQLAVARGTLTYDADQAGECLAAFDGLACGSFAGTAPPACEATLVGHVTDGGACTFSQECSATSQCTGASGMTCGMCTHVPQAGESCATTACASALYCDGTHTCVARLVAGSPCDPTMSMCAAGTTCMPAMIGGTTGTCTVPAPNTTTCAGATCAAGQLCAFESGMFTCRPPRIDGTCNAQVFGGSDCAGPTSCDATTMRCVPYPTLGQACTNVCAAPARCVSHLCQPSTIDGQSCGGNDECLSANCVMGTCAAMPLCGH